MPSSETKEEEESPGSTRPEEPADTAQPSEAEPPLVVPEQPTDLAPLLVPPGPVRWVVRARLQEAWESNPLFERGIGPEPDVEQEGDLLSHASLDLARRWTGPRSEASVSLGGNGTLFARNSTFNQAGAGASAAWSWRARRRLGTRAGLGYSYGTRQQSAQTDEGLLLPRIRSQILDANAGLDLGLGRVTKGALDIAYRRVSFDSPTLNDGGQIAASAHVDHRTSSRSTLSGDYAFTRGSSRSELFPPRSSHTLSFGWAGPLVPRLELEASAGVIYLPSWADAEARVLPAGGVSLVLRWRSARIEGGYGREAGEAFGYGFFRVADIFRIAWQQRLGRRLTWLNGATYGVSRNPGFTFKLETVSFSSTLSAILGQRFILSGGYSVRRRDYRTEELHSQASSYTLSVNLTKEWQGR